MNLEAMFQISDSISFILVTPEFISEALLKWLHSLPLSRVWAWCFQNRRRTLLSLLSLLFSVAFSVVSVWDIWLHPKDVAMMDLYDVITSVITTVLVFAFILLTILQILAYRGLLFFLGACLFFSTRALSAWHAMSLHTG
jgi:hypothetical protein